MNAQIFADIFLGLLPILIGAITYFNSQRALSAQAEAKEAEVDALAFARAKDIYEAAIASMNTQIDRMRSQGDHQVEILNREINKLGESISYLRTENTALQQSNLELRTRVFELQAANVRLEAKIKLLEGSGQ